MAVDLIRKLNSRGTVFKDDIYHELFSMLQIEHNSMYVLLSIQGNRFTSLLNSMMTVIYFIIPM